MLTVFLHLRKQPVPLCRSTRHLQHNYSQGTVGCIHSPWAMNPRVHGRLRRACKGDRECIMFIDCKHVMHV